MKMDGQHLYYFQSGQVMDISIIQVVRVTLTSFIRIYAPEDSDHSVNFSFLGMDNDRTTKEMFGFLLEITKTLVKKESIEDGIPMVVF